MSVDKFPPLTEFAPVWKRIDLANPPKARKMLFKSDFGGACIGVWYEGCGWTWYCGLPKHTAEDKAFIKAMSRSPSGRYVDGKPHGVGYE